jgi:hypothetical protein
MAMIISNPVIRMTPVAIMVYPQQVVRPTKPVNRRYAPEIARRENIVRWIRIVINRSGVRIITVDDRSLIDHDLFGFVIGDIDNLKFNRLDLDSAVHETDDLQIVAFQMTSKISALAKRLNGADNLRLLLNERFAETPGPVEVLVHQFDDLRIIQ